MNKTSSVRYTFLKYSSCTHLFEHEPFIRTQRKKKQTKRKTKNEGTEQKKDNTATKTKENKNKIDKQNKIDKK